MIIIVQTHTQLTGCSIWTIKVVGYYNKCVGKGAAAYYISKVACDWHFLLHTLTDN